MYTYHKWSIMFDASPTLPNYSYHPTVRTLPATSRNAPVLPVSPKERLMGALLPPLCKRTLLPGVRRKRTTS